MTQKCSNCMCDKKREFLKSVPRGANSVRNVYIDHLGRQWNGNQCPDCRFLKRESYVEITKKTSTRSCRLCSKPLLGPNYFYHPHCLETLEEKRGWDESVYLHGD